MILSKIKEAILSNALFQLDDQSLIESVLESLTELPSDFKKSHRDQIRRFSKDSPNDTSSKKMCIHLLFGQHIDLSKLEAARINQLDKSNKGFDQIKSIKEELEWLSGGVTIKFVDKENSYHDINLEHPVDEKFIFPYKVIGGLYLDNELVPVRSKLEHEIIANLQLISLNRPSVVIKRIIDFVNSKEYIQIATEIGRIP